MSQHSDIFLAQGPYAGLTWGVARANDACFAHCVIHPSNDARSTPPGRRTFRADSRRLSGGGCRWCSRLCPSCFQRYPSRSVPATCSVPSVHPASNEPPGPHVCSRHVQSTPSPLSMLLSPPPTSHLSSEGDIACRVPPPACPLSLPLPTIPPTLTFGPLSRSSFWR